MFNYEEEKATEKEVTTKERLYKLKLLYNYNEHKAQRQEAIEQMQKKVLYILK